MKNVQLELAEEFVLHTKKNIFLTGRAGTGKTTFLHSVLKKTTKNYVIAAPTGVAAINAGGTTIHSLFHFPLTAFTPSNDSTDFNVATNRYGLAKHIRYRQDKSKMLRQLELLVIDEISMVRADLLDAIDYALRRVRRSNLPFGGVQLLVIGDLFQLAPVVKQEVWGILRHFYASPFFFDALSWKDSHPVTIELTYIYRQKNQDFIDILNRMRRGRSIAADIEVLNAKYNPTFDAIGKKYITLSTHNRKVDSINAKQMAALTTPQFVYSAIIEGKFSEHAYPAEEKLELKEGAQVMFIRNDANGQYFNGKLAEISKLTKNHVEVIMDGDISLVVERLEWPNKKYELNEKNNQIEETIIGNFSQYPLRLAWAITVHKSQGLTFEKMAVDLGETFAPGQAYVALSRCTSLDGLVLLTRMRLQNVSVSDRIVNYHDQAGQRPDMEALLRTAKLRFASDQLVNTFNFSELEFVVNSWINEIKEKEIPDQDEVMALVLQIQKDIKEQAQHARNFQVELAKLVQATTKSRNLSPLKFRIGKAVQYFADQLFSKALLSTQLHLKAFAYKSRVKKYLEIVQDFEDSLWTAIQRMYQCSIYGKMLYEGPVKYTRSQSKSPAKKKGKAKKGQTQEVTFELYQEGKGIDEIAEIRSLKKGTIESHMAKLIGSGRVNIYDLIPKEEVDEIKEVIEKHSDLSTTELKNSVSLDASYSQLRMIKAWMALMEGE